ncbi:MAG: sigma-54-dependent transcriptional regulator [Planctomycetaceae bacterium]
MNFPISRLGLGSEWAGTPGTGFVKRSNVNDATVLIVDDEPVVRLGLGERLRLDGFAVQEAADLAAARRRLRGPAPSLVLLDVQFPDGSGLELLPEVRQEWPDTPVVMMTAHGSLEGAVEAMRLGALNYLQKPLHEDALRIALQHAVQVGSLLRQAGDRRRRNTERFGLEGIVARSPAMRRAVAQARKVAESPASTVLLLGESGTGKGLMARGIHCASGRADQPFLTVTCSAIPEPLLEAEMMGHEKGAFTDAKARRRGVFEAAHGGTVFLDEIGDMPPALQAKLLGLLEDRAFYRVGGTELVRVDVRIIAATHRDLDEQVHAGRFREDLLYRLRVVPIVIPPLRERAADVEGLALAFVERFNREFGRSVAGIDAEGVRMLQGHSWPGNVRELRNVLERAMLFAEGSSLTAEDFLVAPGYRPRTAAATPVAAAPENAGTVLLPTEGLRIEDVEESLVRQAMQRASGNKSRAAKLLGLSRDQIRYRLDKFADRADTR